MSLVKPIINDIVAFDANYSTTITFVATGGDQIVANEIQIFNNATDQMVYTQKTTTYALEHIIPPNILTNGVYYKVKIRTYDVLNNTSPWSDSVPFYCYTTPILELNIRNEQTVTSSSQTITLKYNQRENEKVDYCVINIYTNEGVLIDTSGKLYSDNYPPIIFSHTVIGLINHSRYYIEGNVVTLNQTVVPINRVYFNVNFEQPDVPSDLTLTAYNCNGYVEARSSYALNINGITYPEFPTYINDDTMLSELNAVGDMDINLCHLVTWKNLDIPTDFILRLWFYSARQFKIFDLYDDYHVTYVTCYYNRSETTDYITFETDNGTHIDVSLNGFYSANTKFFLWLKVVGDTWDIHIKQLSEDITETIVWNDANTNNVLWNGGNTSTWYHADSTEPIAEIYGDYVASATIENPISDLYKLSNLTLSNGIFDELHISSDTEATYDEGTSIIFPTEYTEDTLLLINFNGNVKNQNGRYITKFLLKRRGENDLSWINIAEVNVPDNVPTYLKFEDSFIPSNIKQSYALITTMNGMQSEAIIKDVTPHWDFVFIADKDNKFKLNNAVIYNNHSQNIQNATLMPIGAKYPIVIQNSECNYRSGSLQAKILGYKFETDHIIDRASITQQLKDILSFLTNGKAKSLTDYNGNIFIFKVVNSPTIMFDGNYGNGIATISFDWVEQSQYNDYNTMLELGLFDKIS